jgi:periplasmic protein CpxP/Spy
VKKYLFIILCLFCAVALVPQFALAQESSSDQAQSGRHWPTPDEVVVKMDSKLSLSDDQKAKITPIIAERQEKMKSLASEGGRRRKKAHEMKAIMEDSDKKIKALLTDDQKKKYDELEQEMRTEHRQSHHTHDSD